MIFLIYLIYIDQKLCNGKIDVSILELNDNIVLYRNQ